MLHDDTQYITRRIRCDDSTFAFLRCLNDLKSCDWPNQTNPLYLVTHMPLFVLSNNFRNALVVVSEDSACSTHTGWHKIRRTNTSKWFWSIHHTMPSVATRRSTGSARPSWSIVKCVVLHQPARVRAVSVRDTDFHKRSVVHDVLPGSARIVCIYEESDRMVVFHITECRGIYFHFMYATPHPVYLVEIKIT